MKSWRQSIGFVTLCLVVVWGLSAWASVIATLSAQAATAMTMAMRDTSSPLGFGIALTLDG